MTAHLLAIAESGCLQKRQMLAERAVENAREVEKAYGADVDESKSYSLP